MAKWTFFIIKMIFHKRVNVLNELFSFLVC